VLRKNSFLLLIVCCLLPAACLREGWSCESTSCLGYGRPSRVVRSAEDAEDQEPRENTWHAGKKSGLKWKVGTD
jgi:hypothetical protein